jgi:hypothetical protein
VLTTLIRANEKRQRDEPGKPGQCSGQRRMTPGPPRRSLEKPTSPRPRRFVPLPLLAFQLVDELTGRGGLES